ncbi:hypothetical protein [Anditalea andensis]|nr:hypothetical protein [Anditalea andensis]
MYRRILIFAMAIISMPLLAQEEEKPVVYDYDNTRYGMAIDIIPVFWR